MSGLPPSRNWLQAMQLRESVGSRGRASRHCDDEGASRMMFGMRVRGGLLAALIMVAAPMGGALLSVPAQAQTEASITVEGHRRVEVETIRSYFKPGPGGRLGQAQIDEA